MSILQNDMGGGVDTAKVGVFVGGGIALAITLAFAVTDVGTEQRISRVPIGIATEVDYSLLKYDTSIADLERGRSYYAQLCMSCHGGRGAGYGEWAYRVTPRPANLTSTRIRARTDEQLLKVVRDGMVGTPMAGWKDRLSPTQLEQVIIYVRYLGRAMTNEQQS